ncbi:MAG: molybdate ABC transporter substrate-binding protein [Acetobacteraceae bacterium]|nr:molybdate ABC transporter substrate-binding protein [Acetobacteraceae bacterium]
MLLRRRCLLALASGILTVSPALAQDAPLTVFAAASLQDGLRALDPLWRQRGGRALRLSFAASSALARQIEQGAPADLFASADETWMDYLAQRGLIRPETRQDLLGNALVLVTPADRPLQVDLVKGVDLLSLLGPEGRLATGDPAHVPAGRYAQQALTWLGAWDKLAPRLARADNVRAALLLVERGEAPLGIVYATDAAASRRVRVAGTFPPGSHTPVSYPFALTRNADPAARDLLRFLVGPEAAAVWRNLGFTVRG